MHDAFADINGHRLRYRVRGEGPLAIFGHGLMGSIDSLGIDFGELDPLYERVRLLMYDARGHGQSEGPEAAEAYSWEALGLDMVSFAAEHAPGERAIFGGGSMGAATSLWVALERPELVRALVIVAPPPLGHAEMRGPTEHQALQLFDILSVMIQNFGFEKTVDLVATMPTSSPEEAESRRQMLLAQNPRTLMHVLRGVVQSPFHDPEEYRRIAVPTLIIAHEGDGLHPVRAARLLHEAVPGSRLKVAPSSSYWSTHRSEFVEEVMGFLDFVESQGSQ